MKKDSGFTLIELMIVIAVIVIAGGIGALSVSRYLPDYRLSSDVRELQSTLQQARLAAVKRRVPVVVSFNTAADTVQVFTDDVVNNGVFDAGETVLKNVANSRGVDFYAAVAGPVQFNPRGFPTQGVRLTIAGNSRIIKSGNAGVSWQ